MSVVNLKYGVGVFGMKRVKEEQQSATVEAKRQKVEPGENLLEEELEDFKEDANDDTEIEWLIDASLSDDPFKNHLANKILEKNSSEIKVPRKEETPKPILEKKQVKQTKSEGSGQEKILDALKEKVREKLEISELKIIQILKEKDFQISKLNFELESKQLEQTSVEEKMKNTLLTTANMIKSLRMEKEELELKVLESEQRQDLCSKREENLEMSIKEALSKDMQKEKTLLDLKEQIEALTKTSEEFKAQADKAVADKNLREKQLMDENKDLIKSSVEFKAVADKAIADKNLLEKQLRDENKEHISEVSLLKKDFEDKNFVLKDELKKLKSANDEAHEKNKQSQMKLATIQSKEKELLEKVEELEKVNKEKEIESTSAESLILRKINIINQKEKDIQSKDICIKSLEKEIDNLKSRQNMGGKE